MNIDDKYQELLEKEIHVQESIRAAKKAYRANMEKMLENEIRVQESLKAAEKARKETEEEMLENEFRVKESIKAAQAMVSSLEREIDEISEERRRIEGLYKNFEADNDQFDGMFKILSDETAIKPEGMLERAVQAASKLSDRFDTLSKNIQNLHSLISNKLVEMEGQGQQEFIDRLATEKGLMEKLVFKFGVRKKKFYKESALLSTAFEEKTRKVQQYIPVEKTKTASGKRNMKWVWGSIAAVLAFIVFGTWQYDMTRTVDAGEYGMELCSTYRGSSEIQGLVDEKRYDEALQAIDEELARTFNAEAYPEESRAQAQREFVVRQQELKLQKASVLLLQDKKSDARRILKELDTPDAQKILDKLFLPW